MSKKQKLTMIITMLMGGFFGLLNETLLVTALPSIMKDFEISYTQVQWLTTAFLLTNGLLFLCPRLLYNVIQQDKCF